MDKIVSKEQRLANRKNAQRSTGPRTPAGKTRSARNALKHGLLARDVVINGLDRTETQEDFDSLLADFINEFKPRTLIEETLVERIATGYWRLRRAQRFEAGAVRDALETSDPQTLSLERLRAELDSAERALDRHSRLNNLREIPDDQLTPDLIREIEILLQDFVLVAAADLYGVNPAQRIEVIRKNFPHALAALQKRIHGLRAELETAERGESHRLARRAFTSAIPDRDALLKIVRYENMLDRQIHRALAELRRLRSVPYYGTNQEKRTRKTKSFETDA